MFILHVNNVLDYVIYVFNLIKYNDLLFIFSYVLLVYSHIIYIPLGRKKNESYPVDGSNK